MTSIKDGEDTQTNSRKGVSDEGVSRDTWTRRGAEQLTWIAPLATLAIIVGVWEVVVRTAEIPSFLLPAPSAIVDSIGANWNQLMEDSFVTLQETLIGFALSAVFGIAVAFVIVMWPLAGKAMFPILVASQVIPKVAIAPLMVVWIGAGVTTATLIAFIMGFFPVVVNSTLGMTSVNKASIDLMNSMGASKSQIFRYLRLPSALPHIISGLQLAIAMAIVGAIVGEFVGSNSGLGYRLIVSQGNLRTDLLFAALIVLTVLGLLLYYLVELAGKFFLRNRR